MTQVLIKTENMSREDWLNHRKKGIGGSDAAAVLGISKYKTPFEVWHEKSEDYVPNTDDPSEAAYFGNLLEDVVAEEFARRTGKRVRRKNFMLQHSEHPFMIADVDRVVVGEDAILECKTANQFLAKDWDGEEVPDAYLVQVQHYLAVTGKSKAYFAVLIGGQRFVWKEIDRDEELIHMIIQQEKRFWEDHVVTGIAPALDGSSAAERYIKEKYPESDGEKVVNLGKSDLENLKQLEHIKEQIKLLDVQKAEIENNIKQQMKDAETALTTEYKVVWKNVVRRGIDTTRIKKEKPELYDQYAKESVSRPFKIQTV
ncbi:YqaJ viral recombinase family protein [Geomicrobium sediminis]|uniref:Phage-type endonuclease n=1 Tax=Geomicrobium sediminis TaxID=1347788 RepID=A0ABS2PF28_9BACL|nr:YqaJ viral recombinase family protein [Geomicrobium sediminis]MBM7634039.1 putative phage-type endonuclease [Geomicrobium sediminis]